MRTANPARVYRIRYTFATAPSGTGATAVEAHHRSPPQMLRAAKNGAVGAVGQGGGR